MNQMRVVHIITGLEDGGAEAVLYRLCLHDADHQHHVISLTGQGKYGQMLGKIGTPVLALNMRRGWVSVHGLWSMWKLIYTTRPHVVQTWMYHADFLGGLISRLAGIRNVNWGIHNTALVWGQNSWTSIAVARACGAISRIVPRTIVCCAERTWHAHASLHYDAARMRVIPNGYDLALFRRDDVARTSTRSALSLVTDQPVIGFVARHDPQKDHGTLLRALALLRHVGIEPKCLLIGSGMDENNTMIQSMIIEHGLVDQVQLLGRRDDIPGIMNALDLHVMSSSAEAFPNVLAEAMACGTPCVSTDVGDAAAILGGTGWIVPPRDPAALAEAIATALAARTQPGWTERQAAARAHIVANFSIQRMVQRYHAAWESGQLNGPAK